MKIGFHTRITNPLSLGYYAYLACIDSWRKIADKVVVVDGGSDDGSIELLLNWIEHDPKVIVLSDEYSHWGKNFAWEQSTLNMQLGHEALSDCDWIIRTDGDHVIDLQTATTLREELETRFSDRLTVSLNVFSFENGSYYFRLKPRNWIINNRLSKAKGLIIGWGRDRAAGSLSDHPIYITETDHFIDPENNLTKTVLIGELVETGEVCSVKVCKYGHFFFDKEQVIRKCRIWDDAVVKYSGKKPKTRLEILYESGLIGIEDYMTKSAILTIKHPLEISRVIEKFYQSDMLGGAIYLPGIRLFRKILSVFIRFLHLTDRIRQ